MLVFYFVFMYVHQKIYYIYFCKQGASICVFLSYMQYMDALIE